MPNLLPAIAACYAAAVLAWVVVNVILWIGGM